MEKIITLLEEIKDGIDYLTCQTLIDEGIFDSFDIIQTINSLNEEFDIEIPATEIIAENFNSAASLWAMVERLLED
ncbi:MAG: phosphopantetheine-binding protein [Oscillospiraceae bacterium]